jgi:hypothetical protein
MIKLDDNLLQELGLAALSADDRRKMLAHIYETLEMRVGMELAKQMTDAQLGQFEEFINRNDEPGALQWLETNFPNYKDVVAAEFDKLKAEISQVAPQILASSQQQSQAMPAPQQYEQPAAPQPQYSPAPQPQQYAPAPVMQPPRTPYAPPQPAAPSPAPYQQQPPYRPQQQPVQQPYGPAPAAPQQYQQPYAQLQYPQYPAQPAAPQQPQGPNPQPPQQQADDNPNNYGLAA